MPMWLPAVVVGAMLQIVAIGLAFREWTTWKQGPAHLPADDPEREFAFRRFRRRGRISLLIVLVGILIPLGDLETVFGNSPLPFALHWLCVLGLVVVIVIIALGDLAASLASFQTARTELKREREALQAEIRQYQSSRGESGAPPKA